jgi:hypothetical protein
MATEVTGEKAAESAERAVEIKYGPHIGLNVVSASKGKINWVVSLKGGIPLRRFRVEVNRNNGRVGKVSRT